MKTAVVLVVSVEVPDGWHCNLTSEPIEGGGYLYTGHLRRHSRDPSLDFDLSDITRGCERAINERMQSAVTSGG